MILGNAQLPIIDKNHAIFTSLLKDIIPNPCPNGIYVMPLQNTEFAVML
jgi:hypothetical protein